MKKIRIDDLSFKVFISRNEISKKIIKLRKEVIARHQNCFPICLIVLNGAKSFAREFLQSLEPSPEIHFINVKSYVGTSSTGKVLVKSLPNRKLKNKKVLLIEDIVDTGNTLSFLKTELIKNGAKQVECVTLLFKPMKYNYDSFTP